MMRKDASIILVLVIVFSILGCESEQQIPEELPQEEPVADVEELIAEEAAEEKPITEEPKPVCGDGKCEKESCFDCPEDCGKCKATFDLEDWPDPFDKDSVIVVGAEAPSSDVLAAVDIATNLKVESEAVMDVEVSKPQSYNFVIISSMECCKTIKKPCNSLAEKVGELYCESWGYKENEGIIRVLENGNKAAIIVAGTTGLDTRRCAKALTTKKLKGNQVVVKGGSLEDIRIVSLP